jgi:hypothetical protein
MAETKIRAGTFSVSDEAQQVVILSDPPAAGSEESHGHAVMGDGNDEILRRFAL